MGPGGHYYFETLNKNLLKERPPYHFFPYFRFNSSSNLKNSFEFR